MVTWYCLTKPPTEATSATPGDGPELILDLPVLEGAQLRERVLAGLVDQSVFQRPADAGRIGPELRRDPLRELARHAAQIFQYPAARPIQVSAVLEDDVDQRGAVKAIGPDRFDLWGRQQLRHDRIRDLIFDDVGAAVRPIGRHDDLDVGEIRDGIQRGGQRRPNAAADGHDHQYQHEERVPRAELDDASDHFLRWPWDFGGPAIPGMSAMLPAPASKRLSESMRKLPDVTTSSPALRPSSTSKRSANRGRADLDDDR